MLLLFTSKKFYVLLGWSLTFFLLEDHREGRVQKFGKQKAENRVVMI